MKEISEEFIFNVSLYKKMDNLIHPGYYGMKKGVICTDHPLCDLYDRAYRKDPLHPSTQTFDRNIGIWVKGQDAGTLFKPTLKVLLDASSPSLLGNGEENVSGEDARLSREILARDLKFTNETDFSESLRKILEHLKEDFLPNVVLLLVLSKMEIYDKGGLFKSHKHRPLTPNHVATLLLEIRSNFKGGKLVLTFGDKGKSSIQLKDKATDKLAYCAIFTDAAVVPLASCTCAVLEFCIYTSDSADGHLPTVDSDIYSLLLEPENNNTKPKKKPRITKEIIELVDDDDSDFDPNSSYSDFDSALDDKRAKKESAEDSEDSDSDYFYNEIFFDKGKARPDKSLISKNIRTLFKHLKRPDEGIYDELLFPNFKVFNEIEDILFDHNFKKEWLGLPTWHLYMEGLNISLLKGVDQAFHQYFSSKFNIELLPVIYYKCSYPSDAPERSVNYITLYDDEDSKQRLPKILTLSPSNIKADLVFCEEGVDFHDIQAELEEVAGKYSYYASVFLIKGWKSEE